MGLAVRVSVLALLVGTVLAAAGSDSETTSAPTPTAAPSPAPTSTAVPTPSPIPSPSATPSPEPTPEPTPEVQALFEYSRAVNLLRAAQYEDAIPAYGLVIRLLPDFALAYNGRGVANYHEERLGPALEDFNRAIELKPEFADAYVNRALVYRDQGDTESAIADLEEALSIYEADRDIVKRIEVSLLLDAQRLTDVAQFRVVLDRTLLKHPVVGRRHALGAELLHDRLALRHRDVLGLHRDFLRAKPAEHAGKFIRQAALAHDRGNLRRLALNLLLETGIADDPDLPRAAHHSPTVVTDEAGQVTDVAGIAHQQRVGTPAAQPLPQRLKPRGQRCRRASGAARVPSL